LHIKIYVSNSSSLNLKKGWGRLMARIQISNDSSGRIIVSFPYDPLLVEKVKSIDGRRWHPAEKHWSFPNDDGILDKILKVFGDKEVEMDPALRTASSKTKDTPSPLEGEGRGEGYNFEDLRRELVSRKYSYKTIKAYLYYNKDFINYVGKRSSRDRMLWKRTNRTIQST
jgi:hypothetical protein